MSLEIKDLNIFLSSGDPVVKNISSAKELKVFCQEGMKKKGHTTASGEDCQEAILVLHKKHGMVRSVNVA